MTDIRKDLLLQQGPLVIALILAHAGLFVAAWLGLSLVKSLRGTPSIIYALVLSTSATPVFGLAILKPILGPTSAGAVGLVAPAINLTVPPAVILLEMDAAAKHQQGATDPFEAERHPNGTECRPEIPTALGAHSWNQCGPCGHPFAGCRGKLFRADWLGHFWGAIFVLGLILAAHPIRFSPGVCIGSLARVTVQSAVLFVLLHLLQVDSPFAREALVCCSFPAVW